MGLAHKTQRREARQPLHMLKLLGKQQRLSQATPPPGSAVLTTKPQYMKTQIVFLVSSAIKGRASPKCEPSDCFDSEVYYTHFWISVMNSLSSLRAVFCLFVFGSAGHGIQDIVYSIYWAAHQHLKTILKQWLPKALQTTDSILIRQMNLRIQKPIQWVCANLNRRSNLGVPAWFPLVTGTHVLEDQASQGPHVHRVGHDIPAWIPEGGVGEQRGQ